MRSNGIRALLAPILALIGCIPTPIGARAGDQRPFTLPFSEPPGPATWLLEQHYGNTVEAHTFGKYWYRDGQGIHFGVDLEAPCGTPVRAIGDGVVEWVDNSMFGAEPHNLVISHAPLGYASVYGHLLEKPALLPKQPVKRGQVIGKVGDPDLTCQSRPHLHLEIRSLDYRFAYNPAPLIEADWHMLASMGEPIGMAFAKSLSAPNRWQTIFDQPETTFGNHPINGFEQTWPPPLRTQAQPVTRPAFSAPELDPYIEMPMTRLTRRGCCTGFWWARPNEIQYLDDAPGDDLAAVMAVSVGGAAGNSVKRIDQSPPALYSPDGMYAVRLGGGRTSLTRMLNGSPDGKTWTAFTRGAWPTFSPESKQLLWLIRTGEEFPNYPLPRMEIWVSAASGEDARLVHVQSGGAAWWLDETRLLLIEGKPGSAEHRLSIASLRTGQIEPLATLNYLRWLSVAPGGKYLMFLLPFQPEAERSGVYLLETRRGAQPQKMPFVGAWRWRDSTSVLYLPFEPGRATMHLRAYDVTTGQMTPLRTPPFRIANAEWSISPDGRMVAFVGADDGAIWLIALRPKSETF